MALLLDIEGTTTPISFVHDKLFPYAESELDDFLAAHWDEEACQECWRLACEEDGSLSGQGQPRQVFARAMRDAMKADRKLTSLKKLQGLIWRGGYESGEIKGEVFDDIPVALERVTRSRRLKLAIYSSGSVEAQQLLFRHSTHGDLTESISAYFDTTTGPKQDSESYRKIARSLGVEIGACLFLTDIPKEAQAAIQAGMKAVLIEREGNKPLTDEDRILVPLQWRTLDGLDTLMGL